MMGWIRRASTTRLVLAAGAALVIVVAGVVALSRRGDDVKPPPPASIGDLAALVGRRSPQGITADVTLTVDVGHAASTSGSIWWKPGRLRIDLGSGDDAVRLVLVGDRVVISGNQRTLAATLPFGATLDPLLGELGQTWALEPPQSVIAGGRPAYEVRVVSRDPGSQVGGIAVAIGAASGLPVRLVISGADGRPAATLQLTDVHVGPVDDSVFASQAPGSGDVPAPRTVGSGLGTVLVWRDVHLPLSERIWDGAQTVPVGTGTAQALVTPAGSLLRFTRGGHTYVVTGLAGPDRLARAAGAPV
ncbi:MAG TPA: hypothetical protein VM785_09190 [Gaiellales bacterium]|nr:hypothetical protein [Gaiellales bacterium]